MNQQRPPLISRFRRGSQAPGPGLVGTARLHLDFVRDQIATFEGVVEEYGPVSRFWIGAIDMFLMVEPDLIEEVLVREFRSFRKDEITRELEEFLGLGLLTSDGDLWRRQRKLIAPALQRRQIAHYADIMVDQTDRKLDQWQDGETRRFDRDIMEVTLRVIVQALFDLDIEHRIEKVGRAVDDAMQYFDEATHSFWRYLPEGVPSPKRASFEAAVDHLDTVIYDLIEARKGADEGDDLLYRLLEATDEEGNQMTDKQLRDEVLTLFLAGHETTALTITYAWYLLCEHPEAAERVYAEVDRVLGDRSAGPEDAPELTYIEAVVKESMRLYPPAWIIGREATEDVEIGEWQVPEGTQVMMPQCIVHRDPRWFDDPDTFRPERWLGDLEEELPRFAYFPFGGGPRICIGNHFAKMEAILIIATIAQRFELQNVSGRELSTYTSVTQRPEHPIYMRVVER